MSTHAEQLIKDIRSSYPKKNRKFKLLTGDSVVGTTTVPHLPPVYDRVPNIPRVETKAESPESETKEIIIGTNTAETGLDTSHSIAFERGNLDTDTGDRNSPIKHSLLDGCYNESESAESFQAALNEWRKVGNETETETETETTMKRNILDFPAFTTNSELSYFDKLLLTKYKSEIPKSKSEEKIEISDFQESTLKPSISEFNIFYMADLKIGQQPKNSESLVITENKNSEGYEHTNGSMFGTNQGVGNSGSDLKQNSLVTQTDLSGFFLLGTQVSNDDNNLTNEIRKSHSIERPSILGGKIAWNPLESVSKNSDSYSSDSDSSDGSTLEYFEDKNGGNISEDEDMLTLEKLSDELATGGISGTSGLWTELMSHRAPTSSDFT